MGPTYTINTWGKCIWILHTAQYMSYAIIIYLTWEETKELMERIISVIL